MKLFMIAQLALISMVFARDTFAYTKPETTGTPLTQVNVSDFKQLWTKAPIDHYNYQDHRAYYQRYWINDKYFDAANESAPVFLYICGEYTCSIREDRLYPFMVGAENGALLLALEHRFYGKSQPFDDLSLESLQYLSAEQALSDIAHFLRKMNADVPHRPTVVIGGSYPGALSAWFRQRYPQMAVASWSSSGVVHPIVDFNKFDFQVFWSTSRSGGLCPVTIQEIMANVTEQLLNNNQEVKTKAGAYPSMNDGDFAFYLADIFVESVQYGNRTGLCEMMEQISGLDIDSQLYWVATQAKFAGVAPEDYDREVLKNVTITDSASRAWTYQFCTAFGWFQTPSVDKVFPVDNTAMRSPLLNMTYWYDMCEDVFNISSPKVNRSIAEFAFNRQSGTHTIFTNGDEDPWQWATERTTRPEMNQFAMTSVCDSCAHCAELYTPKPTDDPRLQKVRSDVRDQISKWLAEYEVSRKQEVIKDKLTSAIQEQYTQMMKNKGQPSSEVFLQN